jgi:hypothetical protein
MTRVSAYTTVKRDNRTSVKHDWMQCQVPRRCQVSDLVGTLNVTVWSGGPCTADQAREEDTTGNAVTGRKRVLVTYLVRTPATVWNETDVTQELTLSGRRLDQFDGMPTCHS